MLKLFALLCLFASTSASIKNCDESSLFKITELALTPDPPVRNSPVALTLVFDNPDKEITDGTVTTSLSLNYIPITPMVEPLCHNTECPITLGLNNRSTDAAFPDVTGILKSKVVWTNMDGETLLCIDMSLKIME
jgi:hypothetical protein